MPEIKEIVEELRFISDKLSTQARTVAIGLLAIIWAILVGESAFLRKLSEGLGKSLLVAAALCILVLIVDSLQYVISYIFVKRTLAAAEEKGLEKTDYDPNSLLYKLRAGLFWIKQFLLIVTLLYFLALLSHSVHS